MTETLIEDTPSFDLNNCDLEPIHIPGKIQPHGMLFILEPTELKVIQVSSNTEKFLGISPTQILEKPPDTWLDPINIDLLQTTLSYPDFTRKNPIKLSIKNRRDNRILTFDAILNPSGSYIILELELSKFASGISFLNFYDLVRDAVVRIQNTHTLSELCNSMAREIRQLTGFDRVMIYRYNSQGNGEVIAEEKHPYAVPFLGLCYPQTDIPKQARTLYLQNWLRLIVDINAPSVNIIPPNNPLTNQPTDLSFANLRAVSQLHIEYLKNMGVAASMSISIIINNQLWGLIACHHNSSKTLTYEVRKACEFLGQVMSLEIANKANNQDYEYQIKLKTIQTKLLEHTTNSSNFIEGLINSQSHLLNIVNANSVVLHYEGNHQTIGITPSLNQITELVSWLRNQAINEIYSTNYLLKDYPAATPYKDIASGLIIIFLGQNKQNYIIWFRPEEVQIVNWAGNPDKPVEIAEDGTKRLTPRKSFELWKQTVYGQSSPWKPCEIQAALELKHALIKIVLHQVEEKAQLINQLQKSEAEARQKALELAQALQELKQTQTQLIQSEKLSSLGQLVAGIAHEINNPVNFIYGNLSHADDYTQQLLHLISLYQTTYPNPSEEIEEELEEIEIDFLVEDLPKLLKSMKIGADRIRQIVQSLRNFSRLDEAEMKPVDIHEGIDSTLLILQHRLKAKLDQVNINIIKEYGQLPEVECYAGQLNQVFMNILANALDVLEETQTNQANFIPTITITTRSLNPHWIQISIKDNGPGISPEIKSKIFDPFFTTKSVGKGTGLGLSISYQIVVEKHKGVFQCNSEPNQGTEFIVEIPTNQFS